MINRSLAVPSPCVKICTLDRHDVCSGCGRTLDEIARWAKMPDDERRIVVTKSRDRLEPRAATG